MSVKKQPTLTHRKDVRLGDLSDSDRLFVALYRRLPREKQKDILGLLTADEVEPNATE